MKRFSAMFLAAVLALGMFTACDFWDNPVLDSLGKYNKREYYDDGGFQDFTAYAKYYYDGIDFADNRFFSRVTQADIAEINDILDDFDMWVRPREDDLGKNYDFDRSIMDCDDYVYMESDVYFYDDGQKGYYSYNVYLYDVQTDILYYFHNNI